MEPEGYRNHGGGDADRVGGPGFTPIGDLIAGVLDSGNRERRTARDVLEDSGDEVRKEYRVRRPTRSERLNRALTELSACAFKIHILIWTWRGAPARGLLPFFTIHSLSKFCMMSRPTVRKGLSELTRKGWIQRLPYDKHHKNTLYRLIAIRKIPRPS